MERPVIENTKSRLYVLFCASSQGANIFISNRKPKANAHNPNKFSSKPRNSKEQFDPDLRVVVNSNLLEEAMT